MKRKRLLLENKVELGYKSFKFLIFLNNNTCRGELFSPYTSSFAQRPGPPICSRGPSPAHPWHCPHALCNSIQWEKSRQPTGAAGMSHVPWTSFISDTNRPMPADPTSTVLLVPKAENEGTGLTDILKPRGQLQQPLPMNTAVLKTSMTTAR